MKREKAKPKRNCESKSSNDQRILPDDQELAKRYIDWKNLLDKYSKTDEVEDDGISIDDALQLYEEADDENPADAEEALECSEEEEEEEDDKNCHKSDDYATLKNQLTTALQERNAEWKNNGMEEIFNSNFSLSVDYVQQWLGECERGTGRQVTQERETRFTQYEGKTQMDVTHRENISILNDTQRKQLTSEHSSIYEFCDPNQRRVIAHQIEKSTISSFIVVDPRESNGTGTIPKLPLDSFFGNISTFTPFKLPNHTPSLRPLACGKDRFEKQLQGLKLNTSGLDKSSLVKLMENSLRIVPKSRVETDTKNKAPRNGPTRRVRFKPSKKNRQIISDSSESSNSNQSSEDSVPSSESNSKRSVTKKQQSSTKVVSSSSANKKVNESNSSSTNEGIYTGNGNKKPSKEQHQPRTDTQNETRQYPMPSNYRQMLSVNGHCPYKTDGIIIYRPKPIHQGLPRDAEKIVIQTEDLDLSGIKSDERRKKFDNFSRQMHPNCVVVYYMSDSDDNVMDKVRDSDDDSSDDDDPILRCKSQLCVLSFFNDGT